VASKSYVETLLNRLEVAIRTPVVQAFQHTLDNLQIGGVAHQEKATNFRWIRLDSTTAVNANEEFTIAHGAGQTPLYLIPFLPLDSSGAWVPRLKVTRAADASRLYLSSPDTNAPFSMLMEI
jgi:hypothetical protein